MDRSWCCPAGADCPLESAGYTHIERFPLEVESPTALAACSVGIPEFNERFGPRIPRGKRSLVDYILPAHEEYEFSWDGKVPKSLVSAGGCMGAGYTLTVMTV